MPLSRRKKPKAESEKGERARCAVREIGRRVAENYADRPFEWHEDCLYYPDACAGYGALTFARLSGDADLQGRLIRKFEPLSTPTGKQRISTAAHVDYRVAGAAFLEIFLQTGDSKWLALGAGLADRQRESAGADGVFTEARYWIDDMYMITLLQVQAFRATGGAQYLDGAARTMSAYLDRLQRPNGLFFHAPDSPFYWSRGNGWMAAGMTELLRALPENHPRRSRVLAGFRKMMAALLAFQGGDGMWRQLLDQPGAWPETSGTGMFAFAMITGVNLRWLEEAAYTRAARNAWRGLTKYIDGAGNLNEVCAGTPKGSSSEYYLARPRTAGDLHGQAPVLWSASAQLTRGGRPPAR